VLGGIAGEFEGYQKIVGGKSGTMGRSESSGWTTLVTVEECVEKVRKGEMSSTEARNALLDLEIEEAFRFEQLSGFVHAYETPLRLFTWALDWTFGEDQNESEFSLADEMRM
jgi:hypothetical protein